jgi:hypothetical protein
MTVSQRVANRPDGSGQVAPPIVSPWQYLNADLRMYERELGQVTLGIDGHVLLAPAGSNDDRMSA